MFKASTLTKSFFFTLLVLLIGVAQNVSPAISDTLVGSQTIWNAHVLAVPFGKTGLTITVQDERGELCQAEFIDPEGVSSAPWEDDENGYFREYRSVFSATMSSDTIRFGATCKIDGQDDELLREVYITRHLITPTESIRIDSFGTDIQQSLYLPEDTTVNSLNLDQVSIIVMNSKKRPAPPPENVTLIGEPYTFKPLAVITEARKVMTLTMRHNYSKLDPASLRIFRYDRSDGWIDEGGTVSNTTIRASVTEFGTYVVISVQEIEPTYTPTVTHTPTPTSTPKTPPPTAVLTPVAHLPLITR